VSGLAEIFGPHRVMVILRGMKSAEEAVAAANDAWNAGVELVEVPIGDIAQAPVLAAVVEEGRTRGKVVGAGTVVSLEHLSVAKSAGAHYTVAPGYDPEVMEISLSAGLPHLPGAATPTEVQRIRAIGGRWVKVFPASALGPDWSKAIRGPFPDVGYLATGGVTIASAADYLDAGASVVAFGAAAVAAERWKELAEFVSQHGQA
jgi:2-dehydro-3-deoxyphosphogluconate aldolase / (4S)-4-hydroxy-2-oxoglutarate aldolase